MGTRSTAVFDLAVTVKFDDDLPNGPYSVQTQQQAIDCYVLPGSMVLDVKRVVEAYAAGILTKQMNQLPGMVQGNFSWTITGMSYKGGEIPDPNVRVNEGLYMAHITQTLSIGVGACCNIL